MLSETDTLNSGEPIDYGFGLGVTEYRGLHVVLHSGHDAAYRVADLYFPEYKTGIAVLSNYYSINPMRYGFEIADIILSDHLGHDTITNIKEKEAGRQEIAEKYSVSPGELQEFQGKFMCNELGIQYDLHVLNDTLIAGFWRNEEVILTAVESDTFEGNMDWFRNLKFLRNDNHEIEGFKVSAGRVRNLLFTKIGTK